MKKFIISLAAALTPVAVFAQTSLIGQGGILPTIQKILNILIPIGITIAIVYFIYGVIKYMTASDEESQGKARNAMISGVIGLFVILSIWGLVSILNRTFNINSGGPSGKLPCVVEDRTDPNDPCAH